ncbi:uncharacterized protein V1518DRAFT_410567 [Limtongia smithiae]|uniref:uncharacterized protein n=1 Tax=Limtongia smithiae TaxID=1125753 RepID=UPI0034CF3F5C
MGLQKRQAFWYGGGVSDFATKWGIFGGIVAGLLVATFLAYFHARYRLAKGQEPLRYHTWLVQNRLNHMAAQRERERERNMYREEFTAYPAFAMNNLAPNDVAVPPPAYDPRYPAPPKYVPATDLKPSDNNPFYQPPYSPNPFMSQDDGAPSIDHTNNTIVSSSHRDLPNDLYSYPTEQPVQAAPQLTTTATTTTASAVLPYYAGATNTTTNRE